MKSPLRREGCSLLRPPMRALDRWAHFREMRGIYCDRPWVAYADAMNRVPPVSDFAKIPEIHAAHSGACSHVASVIDKCSLRFCAPLLDILLKVRYKRIMV